MTREHQIETLLAHRPWAQRLALALTADPTTADDLTQDAYLRALQQPPDRPEASRAWLARVLRNLATQEHRRSKARRVRETARCAPVTSDPTEDVVARAQAHRSVVEAVLELDEPLRAVVLLRYFDDLSSTAIGDQLGLSASAVRSRLQKGLVAMKQRLEAQPGGIAILLPLHGGSGSTFEVAENCANLAGGAAPSILRVGAFAAVPIATILFVGVFWIPEAPAPGTVTESVDAGTGGAASTNSVVPTIRLEMERPESEPSGTDRLGKSLPVSRGSGDAKVVPAPLRVQVLVDAHPATQGAVEFLPRTPDGAPWLSADLDPEGIAVLEGAKIRSGAVRVTLASGRTLRRPVHRPIGIDETLVIRMGTARIDGIVRGDDGKPRPDIAVSLGMRIGNDYSAVSAAAKTDSSGRFAFEHLPEAGFWLFCQPFRGSEAARVHGELLRGERRDVEIGGRSTRHELAGTVRVLSGLAAVGGAPRTGGRLEFTSTDASGNRSYTVTPIGADGAFTVRLAQGTHGVRACLHSSDRMHTLTELVDIRSRTQHDISVEGARIECRVYSETRRAPFRPDVEGQAQLSLRRVAEGSDKMRCSAGVTAQGIAVFDGLRPGTWTLTGERLKQPVEVVVPDANSHITLDAWIE